MTSCAWCGRVRDTDDPGTALTWTTAVERGRRRDYCAACSREHLRAMEGGLDREHW